MAIVITPQIVLNEREISEVFTTSSGPGGQNVNKVASAVHLRFDVLQSAGLSDEVKARLRPLAGRRMSKDGVIHIIAQRFASQERNREDARARLVAMIRAALERPVPRVATRVSRTQKAKRLESKARRGQTKMLRSSIPEN
ncbi:alternative ribosome rescue aminoacyl-tRNA hydrolase ArfB [Acidiphilium sp.]|uniref:alternative ribosome rescue aminoacyl-tRNA hydrolase ArfB n=1 Tax=Acidiphilium sp. TaxID=527 RepID=UPI003D065A89